MISFECKCDECGKSIGQFSTVFTGTGRALIDGVDNNRQAVDLCDEHMPTEENPWQPNNCSRVSFYFTGREM